MIAIMLLSHGPLANGLLTSYQFFNDDHEQIEALCLQAEDDPAQFGKRIQEAFIRINSNDGVLVFTDIPGGSPANQALLFASTQTEKIAIISGCNMLMLMEAAISRTFMEFTPLVEHCISKGKESIMELHATPVETNDNDAEF